MTRGCLLDARAGRLGRRNGRPGDRADLGVAQRPTEDRDLRDVADEAVVTAAVQTFQLEDARLLAVRREVGLVEEALRGRRFRVRM